MIQRASSLARNAAAQATSQPVPGVPSMNPARAGEAADTEATIGVVMWPGATALTRMPWRPCALTIAPPREAITGTALPLP